ncbi:MAG: HEAT repeat domain-containing protein [Pirellulales bacterium]|nr:HEAT repeat domain-containing protein [Pirellulales bacterium]
MSAQIDPIIRKLIERLGDPDPVIRRNAVGALRLQGAKAAAAAPAISALLNDRDQRVRQEARRAISRLRPAAA